MAGRPTHRQLLNKYPNIYKDFPGLKQTFFREKAYTEIHPTVEDAKEAKESLERYQEIDNRLSKGDPEDYLTMLRDANPESERNFILDFLPKLHKSNRPAFIAITKPVLKNALRVMFNDTKKNGNENLVKSVENVHDWLFGEKENIEDDVSLAPRRPQNQPDPEKERLARENQELVRNQEERFTGEILSTASAKLSKMINNSIPEDVSDYLRKAIIRDTLTEIGKVLGKDSSHRSEMGRLLKDARSSKFNGESHDRLLTAYLSRAKSIAPEIYKKVKSEALRGHKANSRQTVNRPTGNKPVGKADKVNTDAATKVKSGAMSERDFLNS